MKMKKNSSSVNIPVMQINDNLIPEPRIPEIP